MAFTPLSDNNIQQTILVIDDETSNLNFLSEYFTEYKIIVASDGETGIEMAQKAKPGLILLDIMMPGLDGFETCKRLKKNPKTKNIPVIFLTALNDNSHKVKGFKTGAVDYITKPFQIDEAIARISTHLSLRELSENLDQLVQERTKELIKSREKYRVLYENNPSMYFTVNIDGTILSVNPYGAEELGYKPKELIGKPVVNIFYESDRKRVLEYFKESRQKIGQIINWELRKNHKSGKIIWVQESARTVLDENDNLIVLIVCKNITKRKEFEHELIKAKEQAEESDRLKSAFLANMSHEIRTPMNAITGFANLMQMDDLTKEKQNEYINIINKNSESLLNLIDDIIDLSKIQAGELKLNYTNFNLNNVLLELQKLFIQQAKNHKKDDIKIIINLNKENLQIKTEQLRFKQILSNLLSNALKYTNSGKIEFGYEIISDEKLQFYVIDTGIGIPSDKIQHIFRRFMKIEESDNKIYKGVGLGLSICKNLIELLGGKIWVESEPNIGSAFYFTLPIKLITKDQTETKERVSQEYEEPLYYNWQDKTILIAEDIETNYYLLTSILRKTNIKILWAKNGIEAVNFCKENNNIDLVLMDIKMPVMDGVKALQEIRKFNRNIPIIAQTAFALENEKEQFLEKGFNEYFAKPLKIDVFYSVLERFVS